MKAEAGNCGCRRPDVDLERWGVVEEQAQTGAGIRAWIVDDKVEGFAIYERLPQGGAHVLFEKATRTEKGAAQYLFREYCRTLQDCAEITTGDDLNLDALRRCKESYRPIRLGEKTTLRLRLSI